jgi:uncharacterized protein YndB with AHSA1/START domain
MKKIELEYILNTSPKILYSRLSTPSGLAEWFADDVNLHENVFTFHWNRSEQQAELLGRKRNEYVKFKWLEDEDPEAYFEFRLTKHELTGELALIITDFIEEDEVEDASELWNKQIDELKHTLGI